MIDDEGNWTPDEPKQPKKQNLLDKVMRYGVQNPNIGFAKLTRNVADSVPWALNTILDIPSGAVNLGSKALGSDYRLHLGHQPDGGAAFPYTGITDEDISNFFGIPESEQGIGDKVVQAVPDLIGSILAPEAKLAQGARASQVGTKAAKPIQKAIDKAIDTGISQGAYGLAASPAGHKEEGALLQGALSAPFAGAGRFAQSTPSVPMRHAVASGTGALGGYLGYEMGKEMGLSGPLAAGTGALTGALGYRAAASPEYKMRKQFKNVTPEAAKENLEAAQRLGVNISPAKAIEDPYLGERHAALGSSPEGAKKYFDTTKQNIQLEVDSIKNLNKAIYDEATHKSIVDAGYKASRNAEVPPTTVMKYANDPVLQKAIKDIEKDPTILKQMADLPKEPSAYIDIHGVRQPSIMPSKSSLGYWDTVKRYLDRQIDRLESGKGSTIEQMQANSLKDVRSKLVKDLDVISPDYKVARNLSERKIMVDKINDSLNKAEVKSGNALYKKILNDDDKFKDFMFHLRNVPEAQQALTDMRKLFNESVNLPKVKTSAGLKATKMTNERNAVDSAFRKFLNNIVRDGKFDAQAIELIQSGKWHEKINELNRITDRSKKAGAFIEMLGDLSGTTGRQAMDPFMATDTVEEYEEWVPGE